MITPYSNTISVTTEKFPFEFTINTANTSTGSSAADQFKLPLVSSLPLNAVVDWGDGSSDTITVFNQAETTHTYDTTLTTEFTVSITGDLSGWQFNNTGDRLKMLNVNSWESLNISVSDGFYGCTNLTCTATDAPLITTTSLYRCFSACTNFNGAIGNWDISNVISLQEMLRSCTNFNQYIGDWNTSSVTNLQSTFAITGLFNQDLSTKIVNAGQPNEYVAWDTSNVTNMLATFYFSDSFNGNVENWDTSSVLTMQQMFGDAIAFNRDVSRKTINVGQPNEYEAWNTSNVTDMYSLFGSDSFRTCIFNQNIGNWITTSVTRMAFMFARNTSFNQDIGSWDVSNVTNFANFMLGKTAANYDAANLDSIYNNWSLLTLSPNESISFGTIKYSTAGTIGKNRLLNSPNNWVISDGGQLAPFEFTVKTDNAGVSSSTEFRMPLTTSTDLGFTVNWGDGSPLETITDHTLAVHDYGVAGTYTISVTGAILGWSFNNGGDKLKMLNVLQWSGLNISVANGFNGCTNLTATATDAPLITSTSLANYFNGCNNFNGEINNWDVSNVTNMGGMFAFNTGFNRYIGDWDTSSLENMVSMFLNNTGFNQNINTKIVNAGQPNEYVAWNTSNVTDMSFMFYQSNFNQPIGAWDVSSVTTMREMFFRAYAFNQDIGSWNVSNVTNFSNFMSGKSAANYSPQNLASIYNQWSQLTLQPNKSISFDTIDYCDTAEANKQSIVTNFGWNITDGNAVPC